MLLTGMVLGTMSGYTQQLDTEYTVFGDSYRLRRPSTMAVSPGGESIAVSDLSTNRILVIDLFGRLLWVAGEQARLDQPGAICFESESHIIFVPTNSLLLLRIHKDRPDRVDTVKNLSDDLADWHHIDRITPRTKSGYLLMNGARGRIAAFGSDWQFEGFLVGQGTGKGKLLAPADLAVTASGRIVAADRKNFPVQVFAPDGKFLFYAGWNQPSQQRGWEATAVAVDSRDFLWVADETNGQFRIFDPTGNQISTMPFLNPAVSPAALAGTIDNRVAVLEETGRLLFYALE
jgi:DNA-binding beta-propeller fold protein YncE